MWRNSNLLRAIKPIGRMNMSMMKTLERLRILRSGGLQPGMGLKKTAGLALDLARNANKYSKMKVQGEI